MMSNLALCKCNIGAAPSYEEGASKLFLLAHTPDMLSAGLCAFVVYWFMKYFQKKGDFVMKKYLRLFMAFMLVTMMTFSSTISAFAAEKENTLNATPILSQEQINTFNKWVTYDDEANQFLVKTGAKDALGQSDYELLNKCLAITNSNIAMADFASGEVFVVSPENERTTALLARSYNEGVTKIDFHWWGATIYLSKTTIHVIGAGVTIGGIWIPEPVVSKILSTLGVVVTLCPGGIAFDYNYVAAGISNLVPGMSIFFPAVSNMRWQ